MERDAVERSLREFFARRSPGPAAAYLFGSVARGTSGAGSDVDVAVLHPGGEPGTLESLALRLEGDLGEALRHPVQLVVLDRAPVDLVHRVLRDGVLVHEADRSARVRFEVRARAAYFDLLPILRRYRRLDPPGRVAR